MTRLPDLTEMAIRAGHHKPGAGQPQAHPGRAPSGAPLPPLLIRMAEGLSVEVGNAMDAGMAKLSLIQFENREWTQFVVPLAELRRMLDDTEAAALRDAQAALDATARAANGSA